MKDKFEPKPVIVIVPCLASLSHPPATTIAEPVIKSKNRALPGQATRAPKDGKRPH